MGFTFDATQAANILKVEYSKVRVETLAFQSTLLALMPKDVQAGGLNYTGAIRTAIGSTASHSDTVAFSSGSSSAYEQWICNYKSGYASANVSGAAIDQSKGDAKAFVDAMVSEFDGCFIDLGQQLGAELFGNGGGSFGQISATSNVGTATITLADPSRMVNFKVNQILQASLDDGTGGNGVRTGTVTVTGVDIDAGTITVSGNWNSGITAVAAGDFLFQQGNYNGALPGLAAWLPADNARSGLSTVFNNVTRSKDPSRLAGVTYFGNGGLKSESMIKLRAKVNRLNGRPDLFVVNPLDYQDLETELGSRVQYNTETAFKNAQISFDGITLATPYGKVRIISDVFCPLGIGYLLELATWKIPSLGELPKPAGEGIDGLTWLRQSNDAYQFRAVWRATTYCSAPGKNGVVRF